MNQNHLTSQHRKLTISLIKKMKIRTTPQYVTRIGKAKAGRNRLILIKMSLFEKKLQLLKRARSLSGTGLFLMEDMSKKEKEKRRMLVIAMKKEREGK